MTVQQRRAFSGTDDSDPSSPSTSVPPVSASSASTISDSLSPPASAVLSDDALLFGDTHKVPACAAAANPDATIDDLLNEHIPMSAEEEEEIDEDTLDADDEQDDDEDEDEDEDDELGLSSRQQEEEESALSGIEETYDEERAELSSGARIDRQSLSGESAVDYERFLALTPDVQQRLLDREYQHAQRSSKETAPTATAPAATPEESADDLFPPWFHARTENPEFILSDPLTSRFSFIPVLRTPHETFNASTLHRALQYTRLNATRTFIRLERLRRQWEYRRQYRDLSAFRFEIPKENADWVARLLADMRDELQRSTSYTAAEKVAGLKWANAFLLRVHRLMQRDRRNGYDRVLPAHVDEIIITDADAAHRKPVREQTTLLRRAKLT